MRGQTDFGSFYVCLEFQKLVLVEMGSKSETLTKTLMALRSTSNRTAKSFNATSKRDCTKKKLRFVEELYFEVVF